MREWLGVDDAAFYGDAFAILPMAFCFPGYDGKGPTGKGGDLPPPKICAQIWREQAMAYLVSHLRVMLLVGQYAQAWHLKAKKRRTLTETVADWRDRFDEAETSGVLMLPLPHPSWRNTGWLKKNPWFEAELIPLLQKRVAKALADRAA